MASAEVRKIDAVVCINGHSSRPCSFWKRIFRNLHCLRIDLRHLVCPKLAENRDALAVDRDPGRMRVRRRYMFQIDFSRARIQSSPHISHLQREPQQALLIKHGRVRVLAFRIRHLVFRYGSRPRVELADVPLKFPVNQIFPSRSATSPCGPESSIFSAYSLNAPVEGSSRPILLTICSVNQSAPSCPTAGSCGCAPFVGTSHSRIVTFSSLTS